MMRKKVQHTIRISQWISEYLQSVADNTGLDFNAVLEKAILSKVNPAIIYRTMAREHAQKLNFFKEMADNWSKLHGEGNELKKERVLELQSIEDDSLDD